MSDSCGIYSHNFFQKQNLLYVVHSKTNTICKKCAQNVKQFGTVSKTVSSIFIHSFHLLEM